MHQPIRWSIGLLPLAALWIVANAATITFVESDLAARSKSAITGPAVTPATLSVSGRDVTLNADAKAKAAVESTFGVRKVIATMPVIASAAPLAPASCQAELATILSKEQIRFKTGSADLDEASAPVLSQVVSIARRCTTGAIEVAGHTDSQGDAQANMALSTARAQSVVRHLTSNGIDAARISAIGHGDTRPAASNDTEAGKAQNRRIEFSVR